MHHLSYDINSKNELGNSGTHTADNFELEKLIAKPWSRIPRQVD